MAKIKFKKSVPLPDWKTKVVEDFEYVPSLSDILGQALSEKATQELTTATGKTLQKAEELLDDNAMYSNIGKDHTLSPKPSMGMSEYLEKYGSDQKFKNPYKSPLGIPGYLHSQEGWGKTHGAMSGSKYPDKPVSKKKKKKKKKKVEGGGIGGTVTIEKNTAPNKFSKWYSEDAMHDGYYMGFEDSKDFYPPEINRDYKPEITEMKLNMILSDRKPTVHQVKTQKAKSLASFPDITTGYLFPSGIFYVKFRVWPVNAILGDMPKFARPCPTVPKHGFVESRSVDSWDEFEVIKKETLEQDKQGEIILMDRMTGKFSGILTPNGMTWGESNDGATGGKSLNIPCVQKDFVGGRMSNSVFARDEMDKLGIAKGEVPYMEVVENKGKIRAVQLRSGPEQPTVSNWIPKKIKVARVLNAADFGDDLLQFDVALSQACKSYGKRVVVIAFGFSLSSHFAVQAMLKGVACLTTRTCVKGDILEPNDAADKVKWKWADMHQLANAISNILTTDPEDRYKHQSRMVGMSVGALHAHSIWNPESHLIELLASAITTCARFTIVAGMGETRHWKSSAGPGRHTTTVKDANGYYHDEPMYPSRSESANRFREGREHIYADGMVLSTSDLIYEGRKVQKDLSHKKWESGFGGAKWASAVQAGLDLNYLLIDFCHTPTKRNWNKCVTKWNRTVNECHNNGKIFTKWLQINYMDIAAQSPSFTFCSKPVADIVLSKDVSRRSKDMPLTAKVRTLQAAIAA